MIFKLLTFHLNGGTTRARLLGSFLLDHLLDSIPEIELLILSTGSAAIRITFEKTSLKTTGNLAQLPPFELPKLPDGLRPPSNTGSGEFEVTYIDDSFRVTRGDRGELRVFVIS